MRILRWQRVRPAATVVAALVAVASASGAQRPSPPGPAEPIAALAPMEVLASGVQQPSAVAVETSGAVLVADRAAGSLTRIGPGAARELLRTDVHGPAGIAVDLAGNIYVIETAGHRLVRIAPGGAATVVASTLRQPRAIAAGSDGRLWVALRGEGVPRNDDVIARVEESGALVEVAGGFRDIEALAAGEGALYVAMAGLVEERGRTRTAVGRIEIRDNGTAGPVESIVSTGFHRVLGLGVDLLGDLFVGGIPADGSHGRSGVVMKRHPSGQLTVFAQGLQDGAALALTPGGDLVALELRHAGRLLRFRATPPPQPDAPPFTNRTPVAIAGRAQPDDRVQLFQLAGGEPVATAMADPRGQFTVVAPLAANARNEFLFRATAAGGRGLASTGVEAVVVHDDVLPTVTTLEPPAGLHVRGSVVLRARGADGGSGVAALTFLLDDEPVATVQNPAPPEALVASATLDTGGVVEGPHTLTTVAEDRAGNSRAEGQLLVVDRTPPETTISNGPGAETAERHVRFTVAGTDVWSPSLEFSWRLDAAAWSPFASTMVVELTDLAPGSHRFEVRARDLAGNEDLTPAVQTFIVRSLRLRIVEPAEGATVTSGAIWIRGTVDAGVGDVTVRLALPPGFGGAIAAPVEGGTFALEAPAEPAFATLTVVATDGSGGTAQASVSVVIAPDGTSTESLELWPPGGLAPLTVRIGLHGISALPVSIDADGDGVDEFSGVSGADEFSATYTQPGIYVPTLRLTMPDGTVVTRRGLVEVYDRVALDARLQGVWTGFRDALRTGDVDAAVAFVVADRREAWRDYFRALPPDVLGDVDELFPAITLVEVGAGGAQYEMVAERDGLLFSYAVWFQIDADGRWRLWRF